MDDIGKCICQICICGRHRCPRDEGSLSKGLGGRSDPTITEYTQAYDNRPYQAPRPSLRPIERDNYGRSPMNAKSTYTAAFLRHKALEPCKPFCPRYVPLGTGQATGTDTIYRQDYTPKNGKRSEPYQPKGNYVKSTAKVDGDSMYRVTFQEPSLEDRARCRPAPVRHKECIENFGPPGGPSAFDSGSVMKNDFRQHDRPERARLHRPQPETQVEAGPFETSTSYKKDFGRKEATPVQAIRPKEYHAPSARFEGTSTAKSDFTAHPGYHREPAFRPPVTHHPKTEFDGATTSKEAYKQWPTTRMEKPTWAKRRAYVPPSSSDNVYSSSYQSDFMRPTHCERAQLLKPVPQDHDLLHGPNNTDIPKVTHYREQFTPFTIKSPTKSFKMNQVYEPPTERFMAESVYKSNYTGERAPAARAKPRQRRSSDEAPHSNDFHTTYKDTFKAERPASCPAKELLNASDEFGHIGFHNGHSYYKQKSPRRCKTPKDMDPLFPATPESQKTDRERSSSRPPSASRKAEQARSTSAGRRSRPTTPRARPTSATKDGSQTSPRKAPTPRFTDGHRPTTPRNTNNSNHATKGKPADHNTAKTAKGASSPRKTGTSSPRKTEVKSANRNNSNANTGHSGHAVPKPASVDKKAAPKADTKTKDTSKEAVPPPIRRPKKDAPPAVDPNAVPSAVPKTTTVDKPKPAESAAAPTRTTTSSLPKTPAATSITTTPAVSTTATTTASPASTAVTGPGAQTTTAPSVPIVPASITTSLPAAGTAAPVPKPAEKPSPVTPMSTTAPPAPTTGSTPLMADVPMSTPLPVEPPMIKPISAATAASAPPSNFAPLPPATLVSAPAAPTLPPPPSAELDLSILDIPPVPEADPLSAEKEPEVDTGPKMPVIAPPPAPAQPVVRMGNGPREADLMQ